MVRRMIVLGAMLVAVLAFVPVAAADEGTVIPLVSRAAIARQIAAERLTAAGGFHAGGGARFAFDVCDYRACQETREAAVVTCEGFDLLGVVVLVCTDGTENVVVVP